MTATMTLKKFEEQRGTGGRTKTGLTNWLRQLPEMKPTALPDGMTIFKVPAVSVRNCVIAGDVPGVFRTSTIDGTCYVCRYPAE